ncbi:pgap4 [Pungitius sinensis]
MPRWRSFVSRYLRWSNPVAQALALSAVTFCVVLPLCCHRLLYSYYFIRSVYLDSMSEEVLRESLDRGQDALRFWQSAASSSGAASAGPPAFAGADRRPELLVTVVTSRRDQGSDFHYLLQVMRRLSGLLGGCGERRCAEVLVCDVESGSLENQDARLLEDHFRVIRRSPEEQRRNRDAVNTFEREKRDYVFCLRKGWELFRPRNVVVLEDDALPKEDFFQVVRDLLSRRFSLHTLYVKLYHPERLQRYCNPEPYRILEWVGLGLVAATALLLLASSCWSPRCLSFTPSAGHLLFFTVYFMAASELLGRHYFLEARRLSPQLYAVSPATECCTPAMLFPGNSSLRVAEYLDGSFCAKGKAKDTVLYRLARATPGERSHSVEPNLISHIGAYSSVRLNPARPKLL